ncbi:hypothetical protein RIF29_18435 [Crotalaria pallida]|uniref:Uncharacterized protein n=1 Tax=Crotalaria pallida TaxID=3830 RepID=A0AAN9IG71_CROPI
MGVSSQPFLVSLSLKDLSQPQVTEDNKSSSYDYMSNKDSVKGRRPGRILMKRRRTLMVQGSRRQAKRIQRKVRTLKRLIPNSQSKGLEGLYRETADYILSLQIRVKAMQFMVKTLTSRSDDE